jgi:CRISPR-associated endonuclease/helicase Cas3
MTANDFVPFYEAVHNGWTPFRWQIELLERVIEKGWPDTLQLPTSSGKTSVIDIAIFLLALEAGKSQNQRRAAIRTLFVVDRRIVVDEAWEHTHSVIEELRTPTHAVTAEVASELRRYGGRLPMQVSRMRGGMVRDSGWADEPNQPLICLSTVDQVGSRILFRGYQVSERTRPVHAGLIGVDSLIVLDETHLSNAFSQTVQSLASRYKARWEKFPRLVTMSATANDGRDVFRMQPAWIEEDARVLKPRLAAPKLAQLREPKKKHFEDEMLDAAKELGAALKTGVVGVITNTIASAREIFDDLKGDKVLLIGRNRPWCTDKLWEQYKTKIEAKPDRVSEGLLYVITTQTVEVGANISFDALVTQSAPIDALRQRFGRLNRLGLARESKAIIVLRPKGDPVYGSSTEAAWRFLKEREPVDFGVLAMDRTLDDQDLEPMLSRRSRAPLVFPGHLELWSQTNPPPEPDPNVAPFLHGPEALDTADVQIVWREDLLEGSESGWPDLIDLAPPLTREALPMPIASVRRWLRGMSTNASDLEGVQSEGDEEDKSKARQPKPVAIWTSKGALLRDDTDIRPGQTIIVPVTYRGADEYGWNPNATPLDVFDEVNGDEAERGLRKRVVRLDIAAGQNPAVRDLLPSYRSDPDSDTFDEILAALNLPNSAKARIDPSGRVITWPRRKLASAEIEPPSEEYDETDDNSLSADRSLAAHTVGVVHHARRYAENCGLSKALGDDLVLAARLHDWGKCDERFQAWLAGRPFDGKVHMAKSGKLRSPAENTRLRGRAGYPEGARHEAASVMAACASGLLSEAHDRDLVLHLVGTHHGWGRPWFPVWEEEPGFRVQVEAEGRSFECSDGLELARVDSGWPDRFASLNRRYGYWGLAYLEAILRRADCMQSRREADDAEN